MCALDCLALDCFESDSPPMTKTIILDDSAPRHLSAAKRLPARPTSGPRRSPRYSNRSIWRSLTATARFFFCCCFAGLPITPSTVTSASEVRGT